ncbi:DUF2017 family protein [Demequina pelophila]|uniref:DUF2017 family protein n=1 Tax=Demequina pelophila TaxID=1638984 RepID=UPI0007814390|nr:DUF2017 family protein [Demequina pelophila]
MRGFRDVGGLAVASLDEEERLVIARIVADVGAMLGGDGFGDEHPGARPEREELADALAFLERADESPREPDDPALLRLLPTAAPTDADVSEEFRRLTEGDLRDLKIARLRRMWAQLSTGEGRWEVGPAEVMPTAAALTDVRLVVASRLGLDSEEDAQALHNDLAAAAAAIQSGEAADGALAGTSEADAERLWLGMLYDALTWLQESLVSLNLGGLDD